MTEGIMKILEVIQHCENRGIDGLLVSFDFYKAFDTVEWKSIFKTLEKANFGENYIKMVKVIFSRPLACAYNNGYWSEFFELSRGCRQGCCYSPGIFTQIIEVLGQGIRQNSKIKVIKIGRVEIKSGQFTDDLWSTLFPSAVNLDEIILEIEKFGKFSGLKLNTEKTQVLKIGLHRNTEAKYYTMKKLYWSPKSVKVLGFEMSSDLQQLVHDNFYVSLNKADMILASWAH